MGLQIEIAQSREDEVALIEWLGTQGEFRFHSRIFKAGQFAPEMFSWGMGNDLQLFRAQDECVVRQCVSTVTGREATEQLGSFDGLSIEWGRTQWPANNACAPGRFYLDNRSPKSDVILEELVQVMRRLANRIRSTYPNKSDERIPCYVGPDLSRRIDNGEVRLVYHAGKDAHQIKLVPNT